MIRRICSALLTSAPSPRPPSRLRQGRAGARHDPDAGHLEPADQLDAGQVADLQHDARPLTAYDADWKLVCLVCTELPTIENGKARVIDLPMTARAARRAWSSTSSCATCAGATACRSPPRTWPSPSRSASTRCRASPRPRAIKRILKLDVKDDRRFTMTIDRVTFDYNSIGFSLLPAHIEKPIFDANPAEYRNKTAYDTNSTNPGLAFGPYRIVEVVPGSRIVLEQNPTWTGEKPLLQAHRRQDHREYRGARGQPSVGQRRLCAGRARPLARPGARLREAPQGPSTTSSTSRR